MNDRMQVDGVVLQVRRIFARVSTAAIFSGLAVCAGAVADTGGGSTQSSDGTPPCPPFVEYLCDAPSDPGGGMGPGLPCPCGPGSWVRAVPTVKLDPEQPIEMLLHIGRFDVSKSLSATADRATVDLRASGRSVCFIGCDTSSVSQTARASYLSSEREVWEGTAPACPRVVSIAAGGDATQAVAVSTTANQGCSASASSSMSGMCASLGDANAEMSSGLTAKAQFNSASSKVTVSGNIGVSISIESPSIQGSFSSQDQWEAEGVGSASGSASFSVKPNRTYCAMTNKPVIRRAFGSVSVSGGASVADGGSSSFATAGSVSLTVD